MTTTSYHEEAVAQSRSWYNRYLVLPKWRSRARRKALRQAVLWGAVAIKSKTSE